MTFSSSNPLVRYLKFVRKDRQGPKNLCEFFWTALVAVGLAPAVMYATVFYLATQSGSFMSNWKQGERFSLSLSAILGSLLLVLTVSVVKVVIKDPLASLIGIAVLLGIGLLVFLVLYGYTLVTAELHRREQKGEEKPIVIQVIKAIKGKLCPRINYEGKLCPLTDDK